MHIFLSCYSVIMYEGKNLKYYYLLYLFTQHKFLLSVFL